jgi:hypothetical protein
MSLPTGSTLGSYEVLSALGVGGISGNRMYYQPAPDGQRFLVNALVAPESEPGLRMVLNWRPPAGS